MFLAKMQDIVKIVSITNEMFAKSKYLSTISNSNTRMAGGHLEFVKQTMMGSQ